MNRLSSALLVLALSLPLAASADVDPAFAKQRDAAMAPGQGGAVDGLTAFLDRYVGDCGAGATGGGKACQDNAKAFRAKATGKKFYLIIGEDSVSQLTPGPYDPRGNFTLHITPFFAAGGYALTQGAPRKTDPRGNPVMSFLTVQRPAPEDWDATTLQRLIRMHAFQLQLVFTPLDVWTLPKKGGGSIQGVKARIHAILVQGARTGTPLAVWLENGR